MSYLDLTLAKFIKPVAICEPTASLESVVAMLSSPSAQPDGVVVVTPKRSPLGIVTSHHLLPYLAQFAPVNPPNSPTAPIRPVVPPAQTAGVQSLMSSVVSLSAQTQVSELLPFLQAWQLNVQQMPPWALVNGEGKLLGLLDSWRLLEGVLETQEVLPFQGLDSNRDPAPTWIAPDPLDFSGTSSQQRIALSHTCARSEIAPLLQFLDKLPIPLMLQTADGQIITQNASWCQKICSAVKGCRWVDSSQASEQRSASVEPVVPALHQQWCNLSLDQSPSSAIATETSSSAAQTSAETDSPCACSSCPLTVPNPSSPSQGVWQFTRFPLDLLETELGERATPTTQPPKPLWLVLANDVSEQQHLCRELAAKNADLVQLNRLKDEFLACISHELKSPLTAVVGLSSLLKEQTLGKLNARQERYARLVYQSGRQLMTLVNDILDLTRLETGQLKLNLEPVNLQRACDRAYQEAQLAAAGNREDPAQAPKIHFTLEIEPGLDHIVVDELRLRQMLVHLLSNALKFTQAKGEVGLRVSRWEGWIAFTVWDTGIGIPATSQHLIFQKFQQLENPLTRQFEGTGLGLVLTQRLARAHGGDVSFISEAGQGSQFTLLLPPCPPPTKQQLGGGAPQPATTSKLVLIVEAVPQYIERLSRLLHPLGYRVAIARSGTEALEKARTFQPRAIFLNPLLPLLSGWDVLTLLKSDPQTRHIPVVITATRAEKQQAQHKGADGFLSLPVEAETLQDCLARLQPPAPEPQRQLTILRLNPQAHRAQPAPEANLDPDLALANHAQNLSYRILEADDLEQANLLARIWQPDVVLLAGSAIPFPYLLQLSQAEYLATLPLVTLDAQTAQAAHQIGNLSVFPCLVPAGDHQTDALWSVIRVAAGMKKSSNQNAAPHILIVDGRSEQVRATDHPSGQRTDEKTAHSGCEWIQALIQYLTTAGYRSSLAHSWHEVNSQIRHQGVDLLLLDLGETTQNSDLVEQLKQLAEQRFNPPILVLASPKLQPPATPHNTETTWLAHSTLDPELANLLQQVAAKILPGHSQSMVDLLAQIDQVITSTATSQ